MAVARAHFPTELQIANSDELIRFVSLNQQLQQKITSITKSYHTIDVSDVMRKLTQVGGFLRVADAGSNGFPCQRQVREITLDYQRIVAESDSATNEFVLCSISALKLHRAALLIAERDTPKALEFIRKTAALATKMAEISGNLVCKTDDLCSKSKDAILTATDDQTVTNTTKNRVRESIIQFEASAAQLRTRTAELTISIEEERQKEEKFLEEARKAREKSSCFPLVSIVTAPITEPLKIISGGEEQDKSSEALIAIAAKCSEQRSLLRRELIEANANLAEAVSRLQSAKVQENDLNTAIISLEVVVRTLGKIRTVFEHTRSFWQSVARQCNRLSSIEEISVAAELADLGLRDELIQALEESGFQWIALASINHLAAQAIRSARENIDNHVCNFPGRAEAQGILTSQVPRLLESIRQERLALESV